MLVVRSSLNSCQPPVLENVVCKFAVDLLTVTVGRAIGHTHLAAFKCGVYDIYFVKTLHTKIQMNRPMAFLNKIRNNVCMPNISWL